ncbi:hypothetical protein F6V30_13995 [Oryzomonas sagensis]|uniref:Uncharacterized protein n=1 Tax=Oryzomonas sagensis TaxID=2603857 RepID=A0ABQ6TL63_9BACT|nr:hypothetical protein [Oryzomonas sagensis]KAB0668945.1 hypothetical protein F6V30_13995 [Oryzomonas sagensis]
MEIEVIKPELLVYQTDGHEMFATHGQVVGRIMNFNEEQRKNSEENWNAADPDMKPVARIPRVVAIKLQQLGILEDADELGKWLERHPEYKRTEKQIGEKPKLFVDLAR